MISRWTEVDWLPQIDLILEVKFGSEPSFGAGECLKKELILNPTQIMERYWLWLPKNPTDFHDFT